MFDVTINDVSTADAEITSPREELFTKVSRDIGKLRQDGTSWFESFLINATDCLNHQHMVVDKTESCGGGLSVSGPASRECETNESNLYSYLLQGVAEDGFRHTCDAHVCSLSDTECKKHITLDGLFRSKKQSCQSCQQPFQRHRASYLKRGRRILLSFQSRPRVATLICNECKGKWSIPEGHFLATAALIFFNALWTAQWDLPCHHSLMKGVWFVKDAMIMLQSADPVDLFFRGPCLCRIASSPPEDPAYVLQEKCASLLKAAENLLEKQMKALLTEFRKSARSGQQQCGDRCQRILAALYSEDERKYSIRRIRKVLRAQFALGIPHKLLQLGVLSNLANCLDECHASTLRRATTSEGWSGSRTSESECQPSQRRVRGKSAPARMITKGTSFKRPSHDFWLDDLSLGQLLNVNFEPTDQHFSGHDIGEEETEVYFESPVARRRASAMPYDEYVSENPEIAMQTEAPQTIRISGATDAENGVYSLEMSTYNGKCHWRKQDDPDKWLLAFSDGRWYVTRTRWKRSGEAGGWLQSADADMAVPTLVSAWLSSTVAGRWEPQSTVKVVEAKEWKDLFTQAKKLLSLQEINISEPYDLRVSAGVHGTAVPLPGKNVDDVGTVIAHALLSPSYWAELGKRVDCFVGKIPDCCHPDRCFSVLRGRGLEAKVAETQITGLRDMLTNVSDEPIQVCADGNGDSMWQVHVKNPLRFHVLRHVNAVDVVEFSSALQHASPLATKGGKSNAGFWISRSGKVVLKTIKDSEAKQLDRISVGPIVERLATTAHTGDSMLCEILGLFTVKLCKNRRVVSTHEILVMRNLKYDIHDDDGDCKYFDLKGVGRHRTSGETKNHQEEGPPDQAQIAYLPTHLNGTLVLKSESDSTWKATNEILKADTDGIAYRQERDLACKPEKGSPFLAWGKVIEGKHASEGWICIDLSKALECSTAGCTRPTWNGQPGDVCCRSCNENGSHTRQCEEKSAIDAQKMKPAQVLLDASFTDALGGVPLPLRRADYERLQQALHEDTRVLEALGIVDYSMMLVLRHRDENNAAWVRVGVIDYLQPFNFNKQVESKMKILFKGFATVVKPGLYRQRFISFLMRAFELDPSQ